MRSQIVSWVCKILSAQSFILTIDSGAKLLVVPQMCRTFLTLCFFSSSHLLPLPSSNLELTGCDLPGPPRLLVA